MEWLEKAFEWALRLCYDLCGNYGLAIILFTVLSKVILLPISVWVQKNSIKMVKMQPEINMLKAQHFGDPDAIAEGNIQARGLQPVCVHHPLGHTARYPHGAHRRYTLRHE